MKLNADQETAQFAFDHYRKANYPAMDPDAAFELYATHLVTKEHGITDEAVRKSVVGGENDGGIDSFLVLLNKTELVGSDSVRLTTRKASTAGLLKRVPLDIVVVQAKNSPKWDSEAMPKLDDVLDMMMDESVSVEQLRSFPLNDDVVEAAQVLRKITKKLVPFTPDVTFRVKYVCFGKRKEINEYRATKKGILERRLRNRLPHRATVEVDYIGAEDINRLDAESADFDVTLQFAKAPVRDRSALVGLVKIRDCLKFLKRPRLGSIREELFAGNVREFAGKTARVNAAIGHTLVTDESSAFWWLNNGVTIIADDMSDPTEVKWVLTNPLIVNGLQTSNVLHLADAENQITKKRMSQSILVRVIKEPDATIREAVITGTNNQTTVSGLQLHANDDFQVKLGRYLRVKGWFYERRRYQYRGVKVEAGKIRTFMEVAQAILAIRLLAPDTARARPATELAKNNGYEAVFGESVPLELYAKALSIMDSVESYLRTPGAKAHPDTATNARYYLAAGYVIKSMKLRTLNDFPASKSIGQLKTNPTSQFLDSLHSLLDTSAAKFDDERSARDQIFKGSKLKDDFFASLLDENAKK